MVFFWQSTWHLTVDDAYERFPCNRSFGGCLERVPSVVVKRKRLFNFASNASIQPILCSACTHFLFSPSNLIIFQSHNLQVWNPCDQIYAFSHYIGKYWNPNQTCSCNWVRVYVRVYELDNSYCNFFFPFF